MTWNEAVAYLENNGVLPKCPHGNHLIDWSLTALAPPCGCRLERDELTALRSRVAALETVRDAAREVLRDSADMLDTFYRICWDKQFADISTAHYRAVIDDLGNKLAALKAAE